MAINPPIPYLPDPQPVQPQRTDIAALLASLGSQGMIPSQAPAMPPPAPGTQLSSPTPQPVGPVAAGMATPPPVPTPPQQQSQPGPVKSILKDFLYGGGQALLQHVGLPTDLEKQQAQQKMAIAQQGADDNSAYRQAVTGGIQDKADAYQRSLEPVLVPNDFPIPQLAGKTVTRAQYDGLLKAVPGVAKTQIGADSHETIAANSNALKQSLSDDRNDTALNLGNLKDKDAQLAIQMRRDIGRGQLGMAGARLQLAQAKAAGQMNGDTPTAQRLNKADLANNAQHNLGNAMDIINQLGPERMGKIAGNFTSVEQMMGTDDPLITRLGNELHAAAQASGGVHGLRSADAVKDTEKMWLHGFRNSPEATNAGLQAQSDSLNDYVNFANYGKKNAPRIPNSSQPANGSSPAAPVSNGSHPFFSQFGGSAVKP